MKDMQKTMVVLTTSHPAQRALDEKFLAQLSLPYRIECVCDNEYDGSIGSGGAVLNILQQYYGKYKKIVIINDGGYSKRSINYALKGKGFAHLEYREKTRTLLECILENTAQLCEQFEQGTLVCCSDILVTGLPVQPLMQNTGFCVKDSYETASRHGVMKPNAQGELQQYLHKRPVEELVRCFPATDRRIPVDTGMLFLDAATTESLSDFAKEYRVTDYLRTNRKELCLYDDIVALLSREIDKERYFADVDNKTLLSMKTALMERLQSAHLTVVCASMQRLIHFGTVEQAIQNIQALSSKPAHCFHACVSEQSTLGKGTVLENVQLIGECHIGDNCFISDVVLENATVEAGSCICGFRLKSGAFVCVKTSVYENPKEFCGSTELWELPRFYPAESFTESYEQLLKSSGNTKISMHECLQQADYDFSWTLFQFIESLERQHHLYLKQREEILAFHFSRYQPPQELHCMEQSVQVRLPLRVNLSGTWSDAMPYCTDHGGQMINMAVLVDGNRPVTVRIEKTAESGIEMRCAGKSAFYRASRRNELGEFNLLESVFETLSITENTVQGGGFRMETTVENIDRGSGLGVSSILIGACFLALDKMFHLHFSREEIVKLVFAAEQLMGTGGGWQDQVGALYPGMKLSHSLPGTEQNVLVESIAVGKNIKQLINEKSVLIPTEMQHFGKFIVSDVMNRYLNNDAQTLEAFQDIVRLNTRLKTAIETDDAKEYTRAVNEHFKFLKRISPLVSNAAIEKMLQQLQSYLSAASICGAGGGGYIYAVLNETTDIHAFREQFSQLLPQIKSEIRTVCLDE